MRDPQHAEGLGGSPVRQPPRRATTLTRRQRDVAVLLARGLTNRQIADELGLSQGRVANLVRSILAALGLGSRTRVAAWAVEQGLTGTQDRLLTLLDRLLRIETPDLRAALAEVAEALAATLEADKVDAFLLDPATDTLVVAGSSDTPMARKQRATGLDHLPQANGGRIVAVFQTGVPLRTGSADRDTTELPGIVHVLGVRSMLAVPLAVGQQRQGVLVASSTAPEAFTEQDLRFLETVAHWVGLVAYRAERAGQHARTAAAHGRRDAVHELTTAVAQDLSGEVAALLALAGAGDDSRGRAEPPDQVGQPEDLRRGLERLQRFVAQLLDAARLEQGAAALAPRPTDLAVLVREAVAAVGAERLTVRMRMVEAAIVADPIRLRQAIELVLVAALRQITQPTLADVDVDTEDTAGGALAVIRVVPGGSAAWPPDLRQPGFAIPAGREVQPSGSGLGLYLARRIVEAHGGRLDVAQSAAGLSTEFSIRLPRARA